MTSDLKTLKDFEFHVKEGSLLDYVSVQDVRQNAINWIKAFRSVDMTNPATFDVGGYGICPVPYECIEHLEIANFLIFLHNITEEELK